MIVRKERMGWYIEHICNVLQHLPATRANEVECKVLWDNVALSHLDIANKIINNERAKETK